MNLLAFDGRMGASGDMLLGALIAAGADPDVLAPVEDALDVRYAIGETTKNGILATDVDVLVASGATTDEDGIADYAHDHGEQGHGHHSHDPHHDHTHDHGHEDHEKDHHHGHGHEEHDHGDREHDDHRHDHQHHDHAEGAGPHRTYPEVVELVEGMGLPAPVEADALAIFERLGRAEAAVHGTDLDATHFHEVGADDAIADVVGAALLLADLDPDRVVTTPLAAGGGEVTMAHGRYPVPPPAVVEIAEAADWALRGGPVEAELLTPTGAAILAHVAEGVGTLPSLRVTASGYGAGDRDFPAHPNVLRALVGQVVEGDVGATASASRASDGGLVHDEIRVLETNVDDVSPEVLGGLQETLAEAGARDVSIAPITMKKSRPGHLVSVIVKPEDVQRVARRLAEETGTLGIRETGARHRWIANRRYETVTLSEDGSRHEVTVKVASDAEGEVYDVSAEYDDAAAVAREVGVPIREVQRRAESAARDGGALSPTLLHVVEAERWRAVEGGDDERYAPPSLEEDGFVHLSTPDRVVGVAQYNYPAAEAPRLLVVDRAAVEPTIKYEEAASGAFPHVYGALNLDAVVDVVDFPRVDGRYRLPDDLPSGPSGPGQ